METQGNHFIGGNSGMLFIKICNGYDTIPFPDIGRQVIEIEFCVHLVITTVIFIYSKQNYFMLIPLVDSSRDHIFGNPTAAIELLEYGDFQCRYCAGVYPAIKFLQEALGEKLKFVFRHFPLSDIHPLALEAAIACEAAALQGKFLYMHDMIFENQLYLTRASLLQFAEEIELDMWLYENAREYKKLFYKVKSDFEGGVKSGVAETPVFFINGIRYEGTDDFESLYNACSAVLHTENVC